MKEYQKDGLISQQAEWKADIRKKNKKMWQLLGTE